MKPITIEISREEIKKRIADGIANSISSWTDGTEDCEAETFTFKIDADYIEGSVKNAITQYARESLYGHDAAIRKQVNKLITENIDLIDTAETRRAIEAYVSSNILNSLPKAVKDKLKALAMKQLQMLDLKDA